MGKINLNSVGKAEELISLAISDQNMIDDMRVQYLYDLIDGLLSEENKEILNGTANDFHNFSVAIIKVASDYETALEFVKIGLKIHETNADLLADAIRYGYNCGKYEECEERYTILNIIPKKLWTWRAFSFSIDYLIDKLGSLADCTEENVNIKIDYIIALAKEYQKYFPNEEDGRVSEYEIYEATNQFEKGFDVLKKADSELKFCPKCWLRYADILIERGDYETAEPIIRKLRTRPASAADISFSYVYYLDGLCKFTKLLNNDEYNEEDVKKIYKTFKNALNHRSLTPSTKGKVLEQIQVLEFESEIECPFEYDI